MDGSMNFVYMPVRELKSALAFYRDQLGLNEAWREGEGTVVFKLPGTVAPNLISYSGIPGLPGGLEGGKIVHMMFMSAFPDGHVTIEDLVAEGDKVVERFTFSGTNQGSFMGAPPTGKHITASGMSIFRITDGKIVEHWGENDTMGVMQQLGFIPAPAQAG